MMIHYKLIDKIFPTAGVMLPDGAIVLEAYKVYERNHLVKGRIGIVFLCCIGDMEVVSDGER